MKNIKRVIIALIIITVIYSSIILILNQVLQPVKIMNNPNSASKKYQERATSTIKLGPILFAGILILGFLIIMGSAKLRTSFYKKVLKKVGKKFLLSISQENIFSYPILTGKYDGANIWIEIVKKGSDNATQIHVSIEDYASPLTVTRKSLARRISYNNHSVGGTKIIETVKTKEDKMTTHKALVPEAVALIRETKGTWHIRSGDVLYEETGVITNENLITKIISAGLAMRKGLASE